MIHIWLPTQHAALRLWQQTTQTWQTADDWQTLATLANLQTTQSAKLQACLYFPSVSLLTIQPTLSASQLNALGDTGSASVRALKAETLPVAVDGDAGAMPVDGDEAAEACHAAGMNAFIGKPVRPTELLKMIASLLPA